MSDSEQELDGGTLGEAPAADPLMLTNLPKAVEPELHELQRICIRLMRLEDEAHFPGSQPVSFERRHLAPADDVAAAGRRAVSLMRQEFYAAEKTDGVRYMLLILARGAFMVDRNFEMRRLPPMHFPSRKPGEPPLDSTLLDGELVEDERQDIGPRRLRYLVHDACCVCGAALTTEPLTARLMTARREVLAARFAAAGSGHDFSSECFAMELKDFFHIRQLPHLLQHVTAHTRTSKGESARRGKAKRRFSFDDPLRRLRHGSDGLIFTPVRDPYSSGTCASLLEWKPPGSNSVDFRLLAKWRLEQGKPGPQLRFLLLLQDREQLVGYDWLTVQSEALGGLAAGLADDGRADERVVECTFDPMHNTLCYEAEDAAEPTWDHPHVRRGGWRFERVREGRRLANDIRRVEGIKQSLADGVTQAELLEQLGLAQSLAAEATGFVEV